MTQAVDLSGLVKPGDTIMWGQSHAEPRRLIRSLVEQRHQLGRLRVFLGIGLSGQLMPDHADAIDFLAYCGSGTNRNLVKAGVLDILPVHYSRLPHLVQSGALRIDVMMLQVSPPDAQGRYSLGLAREYLVEAVANARVIIGEINPDVPWTFGGPYLTAKDFGLLVDAEDELPDTPPARIGPVEEAIGRNVASLVEDGAVLQTGIGSIPDAALAQLSDRRDLGLHSGSIGDGAAKLIQAGIVTNRHKPIDTGISVGGVLIGGRALHKFAHMNPALEMRGTEYTHNPKILGRLDRFVAINSAVEVDLTGQVNSEIAGGTYVGGVGGIVDFLSAAGAADGGIPIVALPATAGAHSRIVPKIAGPVTVPRSDSCVIVTEYGIADLRGTTLKQRFSRMIAVAHPDHREALERAAHGLGS